MVQIAFPTMYNNLSKILQSLDHEYVAPHLDQKPLVFGGQKIRFRLKLLKLYQLDQDFRT